MDSINFAEYYDTSYELLIYLVLSLLILFIGKQIYKVFNPSINVNYQLVEEDNLSFSIAHTGYLVGMILIIGSVIVGESRGLLNDVTDISFYSMIGIILLNISVRINDRVIFRKFSMCDEIIRDKNVGAGVIEASNMIASALIISGAITGEANSLLDGTISVLIYWSIGQIVMIAASFAYNLFLPYDIHEHIEKDNIAVGIGFSGAIIAIANILRFSISDVHDSVTDAIVDVSVYVILGLLILPFLRFFTDKILLPGQKITDEIINQEHPNVGVGIIEAFSYISGSLLLIWCF